MGFALYHETRETVLLTAGRCDYSTSLNRRPIIASACTA